LDVDVDAHTFIFDILHNGIIKLDSSLSSLLLDDMELEWKFTS
jgi:hypothetical protein